MFSPTADVIHVMETHESRYTCYFKAINPLNAKLSPICHLVALLGAHHIFHVSGLRVNPSRSNLFIYTTNIHLTHIIQSLVYCHSEHLTLLHRAQRQTAQGQDP